MNMDLKLQRQEIDKVKSLPNTQYFDQKRLGQSIISSWQRSKDAQIPDDRSAAPLAKVSIYDSSLDQAMQHCADDLTQIANTSSMVIAVADSTSMIRWMRSSPQMRSAAEKVHFVQGGQWREDMVGTNALALSLRTRQSSCVFSNEHYMDSIHDWVCYAAPIIDPFTKQVIGVVDLSTKWNEHNSLGVLAVERCASIIQNALSIVQQPQLTLKCFGTSQVFYHGRLISLTPRQVEIITILTLCKQGMTLDQLHQALYGERKVSLGTLKAEMSQLRELLGGMLGSRPYRLLLDVQADFLNIEQALDADCVQSALQYYTGVFLAKTDSPFLMAWRDCIESRLSEAIFKIKETDILLKHIAYFPDAMDAVERLIELIPAQHPIHQLFWRYQQQ
ncbi:transcriptional regulator [Acinetobacter qingfengensis]|uniref:Transcriptional regulator n=1 Tax=Acinetobacter qingfengensis TaxID=1262585 RepID=A0A1E7RCK3_9GAMM|nr:transcriptional regulator [Acinetobacter qingfengensis]KAA8734852.1 transcriptional regulator [Acinetobacter qingfengensis]OEY96895.1 transcriptional regulator [Acinetobacter qingfengensis]